MDIPEDHDEIEPGSHFVTRFVNTHSPTVYYRMAKSRRGRYSKLVGILAPRSVIGLAKAEVLGTEAARAAQRQEASVARQRQHDRQKSEVKEEMLRLYPLMPPDVADDIVSHAWSVGSGRVGRTRCLDAATAIELAVWAHIRHEYTDYDERLADGDDRDVARAAVESAIRAMHDAWRGRGRCPTIWA